MPQLFIVMFNRSVVYRVCVRIVRPCTLSKRMQSEASHCSNWIFWFCEPRFCKSFASLNELEWKWVIQSVNYVRNCCHTPVPGNTVTFPNCARRYLYEIDVQAARICIECICAHNGSGSCLSYYMQIYTETFANDKVKKMSKLLLLYHLAFSSSVDALSLFLFIVRCTKFAKLFRAICDRLYSLQTRLDS